MIDAWLLALSGETKGDVVPLENHGLRIGRNPDNDLVLSDLTVSRVHATIEAAGGLWQLKDANSAAGTYVNGFLARTNVLRDCDVVEIGPHRFRFEVSGKGQGRQIRLAQNMYKKATRLAATGHLAGAVLHYEKCVVLDPANRTFRLALGKAYETTGTWLRAKECFREALVLDEDCTDAKESISRINERIRIYEKQGSLVFGKQGQMDPAKDPGEWVTLASEHFEIRFHIAHEQTREREIYRALERAHRRVGGHFDYYPDRTQVEILASREEAHALAKREGIALEPWMAGFYDGKVLRILITDETLPDPHFPLISVVHEYTHLVCDRLTGGRCPAWLSEGLALYESQNLPEAARERLQKAIAADALIPFELLENNFAALRYDDLINLAYAQAFSVTEFLAQKYGWEGMQRLFQAIKTSERVVGALAGLDWTYERLEAEWLRTLSNAPGGVRADAMRP